MKTPPLPSAAKAKARHWAQVAEYAFIPLCQCPVPKPMATPTTSSSRGAPIQFAVPAVVMLIHEDRVERVANSKACRNLGDWETGGFACQG